MMIETIAFGTGSAMLGALGRRVAGGAFQQWTGWNIGDLPARLFWSATIPASLAAGGCNYWPALAAGALGCLIGASTGNGGGLKIGGIALGRSGTGFWRDAMALSLHGLETGLALTLAAAVPLFMLGNALSREEAALILFLAALIVVLPYEAGWTVAGKFGKSRFPLGLRSGPEIGEALWGAMIGAAAFIAGGMI